MQQVVPLSLNQDWNLIVRTIIPLVDQNDVPGPGQGESGVGDIVQSFFFSPKQLVGGWVLAVGPVGLYPSASDETLGGEQWAVPVNLTAAQLLKAGPQILQLQLGVRYWVESPHYGAEGWGPRAAVTFLFPK